MREIYEEVRINISALEVLAMSKDVVSSKEFLVKEHDNLVICVPYDCSSQTEGDALSFRGVDINNSVSNSVVFD